MAYSHKQMLFDVHESKHSTVDKDECLKHKKPFSDMVYVTLLMFSPKVMDFYNSDIAVCVT